MNRDDERVIDDCGADERSWPSNLEMGWGIWLGDDKIWFWGEQKTNDGYHRAGRGVCRWRWCRMNNPPPESLFGGVDSHNQSVVSTTGTVPVVAY
jgi:hypothetical protein